MLANTYKIIPDTSDHSIAYLLIAGFTGQLKGQWDNYLNDEQRSQILNAYKLDPFGQSIVDENDQPIQDVVNTLIVSISQHFLGDSSYILDKNQDLLSNMKCRSLREFREYKEIFLSRVFQRTDCNQPFWKEKFVAGLPKIHRRTSSQ